MASAGIEAPFKRIRKINLRFRIPYYTQWGENLAVCGSDPAVGGWDVTKAGRMVPYLQGDILFWHATITVAHDFSCNYNYFLVDEQRNVLKRESGKRQTFTLPQNLPDGASVDVYDLWLINLLYHIPSSPLVTIIEAGKSIKERLRAMLSSLLPMSSHLCND